VHECVRYAASLVGSTGAIQTRLITKLNLANEAMREWLQTNREALSDEEYAKFQQIFEHYKTVEADATRMAYSRMHFSRECVYYDGQDRRRNLDDF
jgi:hypothetical protein